MTNIELIGTFYIEENRYAIGWDKKTYNVYISMDAVYIRWIDTLENATTEDEAIFLAKKYKKN